MEAVNRPKNGLWLILRLAFASAVNLTFRSLLDYEWSQTPEGAARH